MFILRHILLILPSHFLDAETILQADWRCLRSSLGEESDDFWSSEGRLRRAKACRKNPKKRRYDKNGPVTTGLAHVLLRSPQDDPLAFEKYVTGACVECDLSHTGKIFYSRPPNSFLEIGLVQCFRGGNPSRSTIGSVCPGVDDRIVIEVIDGGDQPILQFLLGGTPDMSQHRAGEEFRKEAFDQIEQEPCIGCEDEFEAARVMFDKPTAGLSRDLCRMIVEDQLDRGLSEISHTKQLQKLDKLAAAVGRGSCH